MRGAVRRAWPRPWGRGPAQAPPRPRRAPAPPALALCAHTLSPEPRPRRSDPRRSGRRCSGEPRCACACGSASDCSTASAVSPLPARVRGWPRWGPLSRGDGGRVGHWTPGSLGLQGRWGWEPGDTDPGCSRPGPAGLRKGRAETAAGSGTGHRLQRSAGIVLGVLDHPPLSVAQLLWSRAPSHLILS